MLAAFKFLNREGGARFANCEWMRPRCDTWGDGIHVVAAVSQQGCETWGDGETYLTRLRHTASIGLRKVKILRWISGGTPRKGIVLENCFHASLTVGSWAAGSCIAISFDFARIVGMPIVVFDVVCDVD